MVWLYKKAIIEILKSYWGPRHSDVKTETDCLIMPQLQCYLFCPRILSLGAMLEFENIKIGLLHITPYRHKPHFPQWVETKSIKYCDSGFLALTLYMSVATLTHTGYHILIPVTNYVTYCLERIVSKIQNFQMGSVSLPILVEVDRSC